MADRETIPASDTLLGSDPPAHTVLRKRVERAFSPQRVRALQARVRALAAQLLGAVAGDGGCDLVASVAAPLPVMMIAELMGIDPARHADFKRWADAVIIRGTGRPPPADRDALARTVAEFKAFLSQVIADRRRTPGDDLISDLVRDQDGTGLSPAQALNFSVLLLLGGSETTTNLIGNAVRALFADRALLSRVQADQSLLPAVIDETLRFDAPVQSVFRRTAAAVQLGGVTLPVGAVVLLLLGSANRDEQVFADPDQFRLDRPPAKALSFGAGPHYCLGAALARLEAQAVLEAVLALPNLRPASGDAITMIDSFVLRGPKALPIAFGV